MFARGLAHLKRLDNDGHVSRTPSSVNSGRGSNSKVSPSRISTEYAALRLQAFWRGRKERRNVGKLKSRKKPLGFYTHSLGLSYVHLTPKMGIKLSAKERLYRLMEDTSSSQAAALLDASILAIIVASVLGFVLETLPELGLKHPDAMFTWEVFCTLVFTVEYACRVAVCDVAGVNRRTYVMTPLHVLDLLAIVPFYIELLLGWLGLSDVPILRVFRLVRLVRVLRVLKVGRFASGMRVTTKALSESSQAISVMLFLLCMGVVLFASALFYVERMSCPIREELTATDLEGYAQDCADAFYRGVSPRYGLCCDESESPNDFPSILAAMWWAMVTMTSVGYGEVYPKTTQGKCLGFVVMLTGMVVIALPAAIVGQKFQDVYETHQMDAAKDEAALRMRVPGERWALLPSSDVIAKLRSLKIKDPATAQHVARLTMSLSEVWEQREMAMRERRCQLEQHEAINTNLARLLSGIQASVAFSDS